MYRRALTRALLPAMYPALSSGLTTTADCEDSAPPPHVLVMGACGVDYIAAVEAYPSPDAKVRTNQLRIAGGGNAANTAVTLARLGVTTELLSKIGDDGISAEIRRDLHQNHVDTKFLFTEKDSNSPLTYVIVDTSKQTRTCIHTPMKNEMSQQEIEAVIAQIRTQHTSPEWIHFDSRHTEASAALASYVSTFKIPVSIDVEKHRPHLEKLLPFSDVIFTNEHFPALHARSIKGENK